MSESNQEPPVPLLKRNKPKVFYEHGRDALGLAVAIADVQEERALRKAEKHHQPQVGNSQKGRRHASDRRMRLEEAKRIITKRRAKVKKEKTKARKESKSRLRQCDDAKMTAPEATSVAPRKRVSFA